MAKVRVIDCDSQEEELEEGGASFETPVLPAPQDEETWSMPSITYLMLRSAEATAEARLEARATELQLILDTFTQRSGTIG
jgi:hypothetical protein